MYLSLFYDDAGTGEFCYLSFLIASALKHTAALSPYQRNWLKWATSLIGLIRSYDAAILDVFRPALRRGLPIRNPSSPRYLLEAVRQKVTK